jgi:hypothetical protein
MNSVVIKNELVDIVSRYIKTHPQTRRWLAACVSEGQGETALTLIIISAIKAAKGGKYPKYVESFSEFSRYLETRLCLTINVTETARKRSLRPSAPINRLAILMAYLTIAKLTGGYMPPELAAPELAVFWAEGGVR